MVAAFIYVSHYLQEWATEYSPPQIVQIKIILNVIRNGLSVLLFMAFPLLKFRLSFQGVLVDKNLFEEASIKSKTITHAEKELADMMETNSDSRASVYTTIIHKRVYPSLVGFLSKNKKCYDVFKTHLASCLAVENLLFFTAGLLYISLFREISDTMIIYVHLAQTFRLKLKLAMQAKIDSMANYPDSMLADSWSIRMLSDVMCFYILPYICK